MTRYFPHALVSLAFALYLVYSGIVQNELFMDPDTGWHIAAGDLIRATGELPARDPWSYSAGGTEWMNISWLFDVGLSWLYATSGITGTAWLFLIIGGLITAQLAWLCLKARAGVMTSLMLLVLYGLFLPDGFLVRPQIVTYVMAISFYTLLRHCMRYRPMMLFLPLLMILWVNCHGGFLIGFTLIAAFAAEAWFNDYRRGFYWLICVLGFCFLTSLLNPYGIDIYMAAGRTLSSVLAPYLIEWEPIRLLRDPLFSLYVGLYLAAVAFRSRRMPVGDRLLGLFWMIMSISAKRHLTVFILVMLPSLARGLTPLTASHPLLQKIVKRGEDYDRDMRSPLGRMVGVSAIIIAVALLLHTPKPFHLEGDAYPAEEIAWLETHRPGARLFNEYHYGGYTIFMTRGRLKIAIDGRADTAYPKPFLLEYVDYQTFKQGRWYNVISHYPVDALLIKNDTRQNAALQKHPLWKVGFKGELATVFVRK